VAYTRKWECMHAHACTHARRRELLGGGAALLLATCDAPSAGAADKLGKWVQQVLWGLQG